MRGTADGLVVPHLVYYEVANVLRQRARRTLLTPVETMSLVERLSRLPLVVRPTSDQGRLALHRRAVDIANSFDLPAAYDAHYIAAVEQLGSDFWTADERLVRTVSQQLRFVRWLGEYRPAGSG